MLTMKTNENKCEAEKNFNRKQTELEIGANEKI